MKVPKTQVKITDLPKLTAVKSGFGAAKFILLHQGYSLHESQKNILCLTMPIILKKRIAKIYNKQNNLELRLLNLVT